MTVSSNGLGNVLRLQGLKNVSGRRVMPGEEDLEEMDFVNPDVSGTASPLDDVSYYRHAESNLPEVDLGNELTSQSYDVRANKVQNPEEGGVFSRLGQSLANYIAPQSNPEAPPIETAQTDIQEGLPPVTASEEEYNPANDRSYYRHAGSNLPPVELSEEAYPPRGVLGSIADYLSPTKRAEMEQSNKDLIMDSQIMAKSANPREVRNRVDDEFYRKVKDANQNPLQDSVYGATQEVENNPVLQAEFKTLTGMDFEPQIAAQVKEHEAAMKGVEDKLNGINTKLDEQAEGIAQRILNNQSTDADKYYIGLALLMPLLVGGIFGKEAGLGALGGGAKGIADVLGARQKGIKEDEAALLDLSKQRAGNEEKLANISLEKAKLPQDIRKNLPKQQNEHLIGMDKIDWTDPKTGKQEEAFEILPGFVAKSKYVNTEKGRERMEKAASELAETKSYVENVNDVTQDIVGILNQLKDKPWWEKAGISSINSVLPGSLSGLTDEVNWKGQRIPAGPLLENQLGILANQYAHAQDLGQLDRAAQAHMEKLFSNPTKNLLTPKDVENQILGIRSFVQNEFINKTKNKGFIPDFAIRDMNSANNPLNESLNSTENDKKLNERKKQALDSETNYAEQI